MVHSNSFVNRIKIYFKTITVTETGEDEVNTLIDTLWASILELPIRVVDMGQNESQKKFVKILFRGRKEFDVASTELVWKTNIYKPISVSYIASRTDSQFTILFCHKIDGLTP